MASYPVVRLYLAKLRLHQISNFQPIPSGNILLQHKRSSQAVIRSSLRTMATPPCEPHILCYQQLAKSEGE